MCQFEPWDALLPFELVIQNDNFHYSSYLLFTITTLLISMAARPAPPLLKTLPLLRLRIRLCLHHHDFLTSAILPPLRLPFCSSASSGSAWSEENVLSSASEFLRVKEPPKFFDRFDGPSYRKWKDKEDEILRDIEPITLLAKDILHSDRFLSLLLLKFPIWLCFLAEWLLCVYQVLKVDFSLNLVKFSIDFNKPMESLQFGSDCWNHDNSQQLFQSLKIGAQFTHDNSRKIFENARKMILKIWKDCMLDDAFF